MVKPVLLLVESNEEVLKQIQRDLERRNGTRYRVRAATSGREGLESLRGLKDHEDLVALVIADYKLPDMSGAATCWQWELTTTGWDSLALGTTTEYLMRNSPVPVLVHH